MTFLLPAVASAAALFEVPSTTVSSLTASVTDTLAEPGVLAIGVFVIAIPLAFYVLRRVIGLVPKGR